jgi:hypothetical protein
VDLERLSFLELRRLNMAVLRRRFSRLVVCLIGVVAFLLTGCKIDGTVEFQADGRTKIDLTFEDSDDTLANADSTCEGLKVSFETKVRVIKNPKVENVTEPGGHLKCRVTSNEPFDGKIRFTENKDTYSFVVPDMHDSDDYSDFQTRIVVTMPGKVIKASKGKISGNKVIVDSFEFFGRGISITAQKGQGTSADKSAGSSGGGSGVSSSSGSGGFPVWGWVGVGAGATVVVAVAAFIAGRKRRAAAGASGRAAVPHQ